MARACSGDSGLPRMSPSSATAVSADSTGDSDGGAPVSREQAQGGGVFLARHAQNIGGGRLARMRRFVDVGVQPFDAVAEVFEDFAAARAAGGEADQRGWHIVSCLAFGAAIIAEAVWKNLSAKPAARLSDGLFSACRPPCV